MTQEDLSRATGIGQPTISAIEAGRVQVGVSRGERLARALRVHPAVILFPGRYAAETARTPRPQRTGKPTMGTPVRRLDHNLAVVFPNSEAVNSALRTTMALGSVVANLRPVLSRRAFRKLKAMQAELHRLHLLAETDRYLADLEAEVGPPSRADLTRADAIVRGIKGRGRRNGGTRS